MQSDNAMSQMGAGAKPDKQIIILEKAKFGLAHGLCGSQQLYRDDFTNETQEV